MIVQDRDPNPAIEDVGSRDVFQAYLERYDARLDAAYTQALDRTTEPGAVRFGSDDIHAEDNEERLKQLQERLAVYTGRIRTEWDEQHYTPPEAIGEDSGNKFKRDLLRFALRPGGVNTWALVRAYVDINQGFDPDVYQTACGVIQDRILTGGAHTIKGSGLPKPAPTV